MKLISKTNNNISVDTEKIKGNFYNKQKISLIKDYKEMTGKGLKDAKDAVEACWDSWHKMHKLFLDSSTTPWDIKITKKQFMMVVERAIDSMDNFYITDKVHAMELLIENIKEQSDRVGINNPEAFLAQKYEDFLEQL